ncbi:ABC transporter permease [Candidatus Halobonum tyrrellensis]|uniref:ABC transporter permease protein n=1 Tax=Candidatus Halobonum tyrrellensis G22 TaxID=1324957 RepID=V4IY51_9EURY|nr:ABC transporter permease [Candidatus Halobonum tyrrellensis]ESP88087.1 ABC transporter permease protein [Candidatus Halobonum tyrrellensis G22]
MRLLDRLWGAFPTFLIARRNITRARTRSALAVASIVIGVVAIGAIGAGGVAFKEAQMGTLGTIGSDIQVYAGPDKEPGHLTAADVDTVDRVTGTADIVPLKRGDGVLAGRDGDRTGVTLYGVDDPRELYTVDEGDIPGNWRNGALVGRTLADERGLEPGAKLTVNRSDVRDGEVVTSLETYRVAAVLEDEGRAQVARPNGAVVLPPGEFEDDIYAQVVVRTENTRQANATARDVRAAFNDREERVDIFERGQAADRIDQAFAQVNLFLVGIGAISLLVAGVSIANVMLMSAIERREEIGVLRAVGYEKFDILRVLLAEATLLGVVGSLLGAPLALAITALINGALLDDPLAFTAGAFGYVAAGVAFGVVASVVGGLYPAWKAARERPVEALRG